jgi:hypothetical protein
MIHRSLGEARRDPAHPDHEHGYDYNPDCAMCFDLVQYGGWTR